MFNFREMFIACLAVMEKYLNLLQSTTHRYGTLQCRTKDSGIYRKN